MFWMLAIDSRELVSRLFTISERAWYKLKATKNLPHYWIRACPTEFLSKADAEQGLRERYQMKEEMGL